MSIKGPEKCIYIAPELAENPDIPDTALRVYSIINRFCASGKGADISASKIASRMGRNAKAIERHVRWLIDHKMIGRMTTPGKSGGCVTILWTEPPEVWKVAPMADKCKTHWSTSAKRTSRYRRS